MMQPSNQDKTWNRWGTWLSSTQQFGENLVKNLPVVSVTAIGAASRVHNADEMDQKEAPQPNVASDVVKTEKKDGNVDWKAKYAQLSQKSALKISLLRNELQQLKDGKNVNKTNKNKDSTPKATISSDSTAVKQQLRTQKAKDIEIMRALAMGFKRWYVSTQALESKVGNFEQTMHSRMDRISSIQRKLSLVRSAVPSPHTEPETNPDSAIDFFKAENKKLKDLLQRKDREMEDLQSQWESQSAVSEQKSSEEPSPVTATAVTATATATEDESLKKVHEKYQTRIEGMKRELNHCKARFAELEAVHSSNSQTMSSTHDAFESISQQLIESKMSFEDEKKRSGEMEKILLQTCDKSQSLQNQIIDFQGENKMLRTQISELKQHSQSNEESLLSQINGLTEALSDGNERTAALERELNDECSTQSQLTEQIKTLNKAVRKHKSKSSKLKKQNAEMGADLEECRLEMERLTTTVFELNATVEELTVDHNEARAAIEKQHRLDCEMEEQRHRCNALEDELHRVRDELKEVKAQDALLLRQSRRDSKQLSRLHSFHESLSATVVECERTLESALHFLPVDALSDNGNGDDDGVGTNTLPLIRFDEDADGALESAMAINSGYDDDSSSSGDDIEFEQQLCYKHANMDEFKPDSDVLDAIRQYQNEKQTLQSVAEQPLMDQSPPLPSRLHSPEAPTPTPHDEEHLWQIEVAKDSRLIDMTARLKTQLCALCHQLTLARKECQHLESTIHKLEERNVRMGNELRHLHAQRALVERIRREIKSRERNLVAFPSARGMVAGNVSLRNLTRTNDRISQIVGKLDESEQTYHKQFGAFHTAAASDDCQSVCSSQTSAPSVINIGSPAPPKAAASQQTKAPKKKSSTFAKLINFNHAF